MTQTQNVTALAASGQATRALLTREERIEAAIDSLRKDRREFETLRAVEYTDEKTLRARTTDGTILEPVAKALGTAHTHGAVMDALDLSVEDLHKAFCECNFGDTMNGDTGAWSLFHVLSPRRSMSPEQSERILRGLDGS